MTIQERIELLDRNARRWAARGREDRAQWCDNEAARLEVKLISIQIVRLFSVTVQNQENK